MEMEPLRLGDALPLLEIISRQLTATCERLKALNETLATAPEPVAPTLRALLRHQQEGHWEMRDHLETLLPSGEASPTSPETEWNAPPTA